MKVPLQRTLNNKIIIKGYPVPFVKWAGGKRNIISDLSSNLPEEFDNYYEPFVGGGALFFAIHQKINKAFLSDINEDLVNTYNTIKRDPYDLIELLTLHAKLHSKSYYYEIRKQYDLTDPIERSARFIYLNRTCYNGLYRVNRQGHFNVPMGKYRNPQILNEKNIIACHYALQKAEIKCRQFSRIRPKSGDFVYFDPPYHPLNEISFTNYSELGFTDKDQIKLRDFSKRLAEKGVKVLLSNSNTRFIQNLYNIEPFKIIIVKAPRFVNCKFDGRNRIEELLIRSYHDDRAGREES